MRNGDPRGRQVGRLIASALCASALAAGAADPLRAPPVAGVASAPVPARPRVDTEACRLRWQRYHESEACFAPYRTVTGLKKEAFAACGPALPDPSFDCGPPP